MSQEKPQEIVIDSEAETTGDTTARQARNTEATPRRRGGFWLTLLALGAVGAAGWQLYTARDQFNTLFSRTYEQGQRLDRLEAAIERHDADLQALQDRFKVLSETVSALETEVDQLNERMLNPANEPAVSRGDLMRLEKALETLQGELGQWVTRWKDALEALSRSPTPAGSDETAPDQPVPERAAPPSPDAGQPDPLAPAITALQQRLTEMSERMSRLFDRLAQSAAAPTARAEPHSAEPDTTPPAAALTHAHLQRWALSINMEWLLSGQPERTLQQLHALEQAIAAAELPAPVQTRLIHAIGEDTAYLRSQKPEDPALADALSRLRQQLEALPAEALKLPQPQQAAPHAAEPASPSAATDPMAGLWQRLQQLVTVRRRDEATPLLTDVDRALLHALLIQRAVLAVSQMQWALTTGQPQLYRRSRDLLQTLLARHYPAAGITLPAGEPAAATRRPLKIVEAFDRE